MIARDIVNIVDAKPLLISDMGHMDKDYEHAFASDLMSDVLALIQNNQDTTVLVTGLCNSQVLRTAEMMDIEMVLFVRGKELDASHLMLAQDLNINLFSTKYTMYEACGLLYKNGMGAIQ